MLCRIAIALGASAIVVAASIPTDAMGAGMAGVGGGDGFHGGGMGGFRGGGIGAFHAGGIGRVGGNPGFSNRGFVSRGFANRGFVNRGFVGSGFANRRFVTPGFANRGLSTAALSAVASPIDAL